MSRRTLLLCKEKWRPVRSKNGVLMELWAGIQDLVNSPIIFPPVGISWYGQRNTQEIVTMWGTECHKIVRLTINLSHKFEEFQMENVAFASREQPVSS